jgi:hypothetical protein
MLGFGGEQEPVDKAMRNCYVAAGKDVTLYQILREPSLNSFLNAITVEAGCNIVIPVMWKECSAFDGLTRRRPANATPSTSGTGRHGTYRELTKWRRAYDDDRRIGRLGQKQLAQYIQIWIIF